MCDTSRANVGVALAGLAMSVGWGIRGDYGHEAGAMIPGALVALAICFGSDREDWWRRASVMGMCGAIGWAIGGQMSYGRIIGYTASSSWPDVYYGYACLFLVGSLWAGIGSAFLAMSITQRAYDLERSARPLVILGIGWLILAWSGLADRWAERWSLNDTDWVGASSALVVAGICAVLFPSSRGVCGLIAVLGAGWWAGYLVLTVLLGLHMTPPRSDNWAGCTGLFISLLLYLSRREERLAVTAAGWGAMVGGIGFVLGDFANMLGRAQWGPIGRYDFLQNLDYWKWMEQSFGLIMGLGVGAVFLLHIRPKVSSPPTGCPNSGIRVPAFLLLLLVMMWLNLSKNVENWLTRGVIPREALGIDSRWWLGAIGVLLSAVPVAAIRRRERLGLAVAPCSSFGRAQLLFLVVLWVPTIGAFTQALPSMSSTGVFVVHVSFWLTAGICSLFVPALPERPAHEPLLPWPPSAPSWRLGWRFWMLVCFVPVLLLAIASMTIGSHTDPLPGSQLRFGSTSTSTGP